MYEVCIVIVASSLQGVHITVSAGNNVNDACLRSPASAEMV